VANDMDAREFLAAQPRRVSGSSGRRLVPPPSG